MILNNSRIRIHPDNVYVYEMLHLQPTTDLLGEVVGLYQPPQYACDTRPRWSVRLDVNHYGLFYEHEIEVLP